MDVLRRDSAPFGGRVWQQIDATVAAVKQGNCTARRFLEVDGPYGLGLTSLARDDDWLGRNAFGQVVDLGATAGDWGVPQAGPPALDADPDKISGRGTFLAYSTAVPVPVVASEFILGMRNVEAFDDECQPLDIQRATRAARDVALEEERLIYYGNAAAGQPGLLNTDRSQWTLIDNPPTVPAVVKQLLTSAVPALAKRGIAGPYVLVLSPQVLNQLVFPIAPNSDVLAVDLLQRVFLGGIHMAPVIQPDGSPPTPAVDPLKRVGVVLSPSRSYMRLVVGQDWTTAYRSTSGLYHRFLIASSLRLEISEPRALQLLKYPTP
jgi:uncharacterized linocin/CFP29 family protein